MNRQEIVRSSPNNFSLSLCRTRRKSRHSLKPDFRQNGIGGAIFCWPSELNKFMLCERENRVCERERIYQATNERPFAYSYSPDENRPKTGFSKRDSPLFRRVSVCLCAWEGTAWRVCVEIAYLRTTTNAANRPVRERRSDRARSGCEREIRYQETNERPLIRSYSPDEIRPKTRFPTTILILFRCVSVRVCVENTSVFNVTSVL